MPVCGVPCSLSLRHSRPELFGASLLISQRIYVLIRVALALNSLYWLIYSIRLVNDPRWTIFLTHWSFALQTLYFFLALISAGHLWIRSGRERSIRALFPFDAEEGKRTAIPRSSTIQAASAGESGSEDEQGKDALGFRRKVQWALLFTCADSAIVVSAIYWLFIFNGWLAPLNFQLHVCNSLFMMLDVMIGATPYHWKHIAVTYVFALIYLAFVIVYYIVAGARGEDNVIYPFLDWGKAPAGSVVMVGVVFLVAIPVAHGLHVMIARARDAIRRRRPDWGWQGTDEEERDRVMEVSGMWDADVWAPLREGGDPADLYDSEEEEMGGSSTFYVGRNEERLGSRVVPTALRQEERPMMGPLEVSREER